MKTLEEFLNEILQKYKEKIILDTFYEKIEIAQIYVRFLIEENERFELFFFHGNENGEKWDAVFEQMLEAKKVDTVKKNKELRTLQIDETEFVMLIFHITNEKKELMQSFIKIPAAVSTHSDTMAAKINNLCLLSFSQGLKGKRAEILKKAGLEEADLFKEKIHVYQFENDTSGKV